jgi:hypothetical protein
MIMYLGFPMNASPEETKSIATKGAKGTNKLSTQRARRPLSFAERRV